MIFRHIGNFWFLIRRAIALHNRFWSPGLLDGYMASVICNQMRLRCDVTNGCRRRYAAACRSAAATIPANRTAPPPVPKRQTCSRAWWCCTRRRAVRTPMPCPRTERSNRGPLARASSPDIDISLSLQR